MYTLKYCQLCLVVTGARTCLMNTAVLEAYSKLLRLPLHNKEPYICYECSALLLKYQEFRGKCLRAHNVLTHFMQSAEAITGDVFEAQRKLHNLQSKLSLSTISQEDIQLQHAYGDKIEYEKKTDSELENFEQDEDSKVNIMIHVKCEPPEYVKSFVCYDIDQNTNNKKIMTKHEDTEDDEPLINFGTTTKLLLKKSRPNKKAKTLKPKNDIDKKDEINVFTDSAGSDVDEELLTDIGDSKGLVDQATEIAKSMLLEKGIVSEDEFHDPTEDVHNDDGEESLPSFRNSEEVVKKATKIVHKLRSKSKKFDVSFFEGYATVVPLTPKAARNEILLRKKSSNYLRSAYKCELCYRGFMGVVTYGNHMKKHSLEYGPIDCSYCHLRFPDERLRHKHYMHFHTMKIICNICDYETCGNAQGRNHIAMHKGKTYPCDECGVIYRQQNTLLAHKRQMHAIEYMCALCGDCFGTPRGLRVHSNLQHKQESPELSGPHCVDCDVQFANETAFKRHRVRSAKHKSDVSNGCEYCGKTFRDGPALKAHLAREHTRRQPGFCCAHCPARYWNQATLDAHTASQHPLAELAEDSEARKGEKASGVVNRAGRNRNTFVETRICEFCGKEYDNIQMRYHLMKHTGERPYKCKECGKGFSHPTRLYLHKDTHSSVRKYQCNVCPKNYKAKKNLQKHLKTHAGIRPHKCDICGKRFLHPCDVKRHVKYTHDKVPWPSRQRKPAAITGPTQIDDVIGGNEKSVT